MWSYGHAGQRAMMAAGTLWSILMLAGPALAAHDDGPVHWRTEFASAVQEAQRSGKLLLISFHATWCEPCQLMQKTTFRDPGLAQLINQNFVAVSIDGPSHMDLVKEMKVEAYPTHLVVESDGREIGRLTGFLAADRMSSALQRSVAVASSRRPMGGDLAAMPNAGSAAPAPPRAPAAPTNSRPDAVASAAPPPARPAESFAPPPPAAFPNSSRPAANTMANAAPPPPPTRPEFASAGQPPRDISAMPASGGNWDGNRPTQPVSRSTPPGSTTGSTSGMPPAEDQNRNAPLALSGYCPVCMITRAELIQGSPQYQHNYRGLRFQFVTARDRDEFMRSPDRYLPAATGYCVVALIEGGQQLPGRVDLPALFEDRVYLFSSEDARQRFLREPERFIDEQGKLRLTR